MPAGRDKLIAIDPPGCIGLTISDATILLRFNEADDADRPTDAAGTLADLEPGTVATAGVNMTMPALVDAVTGKGREFVTQSLGVAGNGLVTTDLVSGTSLFTRDLTVQVILSLDVAGQSAGGTGGIIRRGNAYVLRVEVHDVASRLCAVRGDSIGSFVEFLMPEGFTLLTWTRRWESPTVTVNRYYIGDQLIGTNTGTINPSGATTDPTFIGFGVAGGFDPLVGTIDELAVFGREFTAEEIEATWLRITLYQPLGVQLWRETHDQGFPMSSDPSSLVERENRWVGNALGYAAAAAENMRANALPGRAYGTTLEDWETAVRVTPAPAASIDERRERVLARMRQRRGVSIGGLEDALVGLLGGASNSDLEFLAFSNLITDDFTTLNLSRWDVTPVGAFTAAAGKAHVAPGAGTFLMNGTTRTWKTCAAAVGGDAEQAQVICKVVFTTPQSVGEAGVHFGDAAAGDWLLLGLRDDAGTFKVVSESFIANVSQGIVVQAVIGANPAAIWLRIYQTAVDGTWKAAWSVTSATAGYTISTDITHPTAQNRAGMYLRSTGAIGAAVADFDDFQLYAPFGHRALNAYVLLDEVLGFDPDVDGATSVIQAIKHAYTHACFIETRELLCDRPHGCDRGPMGGI